MNMNLTHMDVMIYGGAGQMGSHLARLLVTEHPEVGFIRILDTFDTGSMCNLRPVMDSAKVRIEMCDAGDGMAGAVSNTTGWILLNMAGMPAYDRIDLKRHAHTNLRIQSGVAAYVLRSVRAGRAPAAIVTMTGCASLSGRWSWNTRRTIPTQNSKLRLSNALAELVGDTYACQWSELGIPSILIHPTLITGRGCCMKIRYADPIALMVSQAVRGREIVVSGKGKNKVSAVAGRDAARAILDLLGLAPWSPEGLFRGKAITLTAPGLTYSEWAETIVDIGGIPRSKIHYREDWSEAPALTGHGTNLSAIGWMPKVAPVGIARELYVEFAIKDKRGLT
jgi:nucleoside-diphosphate-sugar epimerase